MKIAESINNTQNNIEVQLLSVKIGRHCFGRARKKTAEFSGKILKHTYSTSDKTFHNVFLGIFR
jgi:glutamine amidotransferase PdxT